MARGGIFCLEGQWHRDLNDRGSVLPLLELLERLNKVRYIYKDAATQDELGYFVDRWLLKKYDDYRVGFFAMHGEPGKLNLTDWTNVEINELGLAMSGRCAGKRLYFGSCSVLKAPEADLHNFLATTRADLICGYTRDVDWIEATAFETVLLDVLVNGDSLDATQRKMGSANWKSLASHLGFRIVYSSGKVWRPASSTNRRIMVS